MKNIIHAKLIKNKTWCGIKVFNEKYSEIWSDISCLNCLNSGKKNISVAYTNYFDSYFDELIKKVKKNKFDDDMKDLLL